MPCDCPLSWIHSAAAMAYTAKMAAHRAAMAVTSTSTGSSTER